MPTDEQHRRPIGHVIAHKIGEPPPPPPDDTRPAGRIGPYADVIGHAHGRTVDVIDHVHVAAHAHVRTIDYVALTPSEPSPR